MRLLVLPTKLGSISLGLKNLLFFSGAAAVCSGSGTPVIDKLCGATELLSTQKADAKSSASIYGKSRLK